MIVTKKKIPAQKKKFKIKWWMFVLLFFIFILLVGVVKIGASIIRTSMDEGGWSCDFKKFGGEKEIETLQKLPAKGVVVFSEDNKDVKQIYDTKILSEIVKTNTEECKPSPYKIVNEKGEWEERSDTKWCESERSNWLAVKSILNSYPGDVSYDDLISRIDSDKFIAVNDAALIKRMFNSQIREALKKGDVVIKDRLGNIVKSITYRDSGMYNCHDMSGHYSYELPDGTEFEGGSIGMGL